MTIFQAVILAIVEGLTEFLPVSSTGHMIIASSVMGIASDPFTKLFTVAIQFGAILSVVVLYRRKFLPVTGDWKAQFRFYRKLIVAMIPAVVAGVLMKDYIDMMLENVIVVAIALFVGGVIFILIDKWLNRHVEPGQEREISDGKAFRIGCFQVIAMIPGVSRSAATIIGGLTQGLTKKAAAEFSFFLAVPTMFGATVKDMYDFTSDGTFFTANELILLLAGNVVAFIVALLAIRSFVAFLTRHGFRIFGYYRIILALVILAFHFFGNGLTII